MPAKPSPISPLPLRIACLTSSFPRHKGDVAGRFVWEFCERLAGLGHEVRVITWRGAGDEANWQPPGMSVRRVAYAPRAWEALFYGSGAPENLERGAWRLGLVPQALGAMVAALVQEVGAWRPHLIVGHWMVPSGLLARLVGQALRIPSAVVCHSGDIHLLHGLARPLGAALAGLGLRGAVTVPGEVLRAKLGELGSVAHVAILPMGFSPVRNARGAEGGAERREWLYMGRLVPIKGVDLAIEGFAMALARGLLRPDSLLHIAGEGPERASLEALARRLGVLVRFWGVVTGEDKAALLRRCAGAVFPSQRLASGRHEGLPVSLLEAMDAGLVCLVGEVPEAGPLLVDEALQGVGAGTSGAWCEALGRVAALEAKAFGALAAASQARVAPLAWDRLMPLWQAWLQAALTGPRD